LKETGGMGIPQPGWQFGPAAENAWS